MPIAAAFWVSVYVRSLYSTFTGRSSGFSSVAASFCSA